ncbi:amidohydrolase [Luteithermobacter gelatinilyticus]|uniref:amidohydrolase n=1 Tax=Luteithermobacter gelatinilyticus TaxID=2582913 RepID=UPI0011066B1B|nr:amidohydrolase [Luteithermobacter gelatinilyticus]|tara:strand:- start:12436 stop:13770 length:1335 start_codon:yes stop_codon:yes gene_type:complete
MIKNKPVFCALPAVISAFLLGGPVFADGSIDALIHQKSLELEPQVIAWRRDIHQHPELSNREFRTAKLVAQHLESLGLEVQTGIAHTGVVGILKGGKPGPVVALRADMDALPVTEKVDLPFASKVTTTYQNKEVGVMHACGHDAHTAILMGVAKLLSEIREDIPGTIKFIFQPAEEGAPAGEEGGAKLMIKEGVLGGKYKPEAIFGLHVFPEELNSIKYRPEGFLAASDELYITVKGAQTHGSMPWRGIDPIIISAQIMTALQTIPSRQLDITKAPSVITIGSVNGGVRGNIIPEVVEMQGTIRTFDTGIRQQLLDHLERTVTHIAQSAGAKADVRIKPYAPVTYNDPALTEMMVPSLKKVVGEDKVSVSDRVMGAEDFAYYQREIPGFYFSLGVRKPGIAPEDAAPNHSPYFYVDEAALKTGVQALSTLALDYLKMKTTQNAE